MESFLRPRVKDEPLPNTKTNHHITWIIIAIMVHYLLQELRIQHLCKNWNSLLLQGGRGGGGGNKEQDYGTE